MNRLFIKYGIIFYQCIKIINTSIALQFFYNFFLINSSLKLFINWYNCCCTTENIDRSTITIIMYIGVIGLLVSVLPVIVCDQFNDDNWYKSGNFYQIYPRYDEIKTDHSLQLINSGIDFFKLDRLKIVTMMESVI